MCKEPGEIIIKFKKSVWGYDDAIADMRADGIDEETIKEAVLEWVLEDLPELIDGAEWEIEITD